MLSRLHYSKAKDLPPQTEADVGVRRRI